MNAQPNHTLRARLIHIEPPADFFDTRKPSTFLYQTDEGIERVSADYVPIDCRQIGVEVNLEYTFFSIGDASGYHYEPRSLTPVDHMGELPYD